MTAPSERSRLLNEGVRATLAGIGQLALCDNWRGGMLVLLAMTLLSPWAALMASAAAAFATIAARVLEIEAGQRWLAGLSGYNAAVIGIFWAGAFAAGETNVPLLLSAIALCMGLEALGKWGLARLDLPVLILPAVVVLWSISYVLAPPGGWFWLDPPVTSDYRVLILAGAIVFAAMAWKAPGAAALAAGIAAMAAFFGAWWLERPADSLFGLWGLNVPLSAYAVAAVFVPGSLSGLIYGLVAGFGAAAIWLIWVATGGPGSLPPLLAPYIGAVWITLTLVPHLSMGALSQRDFWRALWLLARAAVDSRPNIVVLSVGVEWDPGQSDARRWRWLDPDMPNEAYSLTRFRDSARCRQAYWDACNRLRQSPAPRCEPRLMATDLMIDADPRPWRELMPRRRVSINGDLQRVICMDCGQNSIWPPIGIWRRVDLICSVCGGFLKPAIDLFSDQAAAIDIDIDSGAVLILCGPNPNHQGLAKTVAEMRKPDARAIHLPGTGPRYEMTSHDLMVAGDSLALLVLFDKWAYWARKLVPEGRRYNSASGRAARTGME